MSEGPDRRGGRAARYARALRQRSDGAPDAGQTGDSFGPPLPPRQVASEGARAPTDTAFPDHLRASTVEALQRFSQRSADLPAMSYFYRIAEELVCPSWMMEAKEQGRKVVGALCTIVPEELIWAADAVLLRLCSGFPGTVGAGEELCPKTCCAVMKSTVGLHRRVPDVLGNCDALVIPATCDAKKKLAEILGRTIPVWLLQVPHSRDAPHSREVWLDQIQELKTSLEALIGRDIRRSDLLRANGIRDEQRKAVHELYQMRAQERIWGTEALVATSVAGSDDPVRWSKATLELCRQAMGRAPLGGDELHRPPRILITGSPIIVPSLKLPHLVEECGGLLICDDLCAGSKALWGRTYLPDYSTRGLLSAFAERTLAIPCPCFTPNLSQAARLKQLINDFRVDGVIQHVLVGCHLHGMTGWQIEQLCGHLDVPLLRLETDYSESDIEGLRVRIEAFLEMLGARIGG